MKNKKISFIIPAYNAQNYIIDCLNNICEDIIFCNMVSKVEIIVVENGSTDETIYTVKNYIKDTNCSIKLIKSEKGVSKARNAGIKESNGEMIIFVDSDDVWLKGSLLEIAKNITEHNADLFLYSFLKGSLSENNESCSKIIHNPSFNENESIDVKRAWMLSKPTLRMQVWSKVFKGKIIRDNKLYFNENLKYSEDSEYVIRYSKLCKKIYISSRPIYKYIISQGSAMRRVDNSRIKEYIKSMECSEKIMLNESLEVKNSFKKYVLQHLNIILVHDVFVYRKKISLFKDYKLMKEVLKENVFSESLKNIPLRECFSMMLLPELFLKLHLGYLSAILCYIKSYINQKKSNN